MRMRKSTALTEMAGKAIVLIRFEQGFEAEDDRLRTALNFRSKRKPKEHVEKTEG